LSNANKTSLETVFEHQIGATPVDDSITFEDDIKNKRQFLNEISHELRAPLNAIIGFSEVLNGAAGNKLQEAKHEEYITLIHKAAMHLENTLKDKLEFSNLETGKRKLVLEQFDIADGLKDVLEILEQMAVRSSVNLNIHVSQSVSSINADKHAISQIVMIIVANAITASEPNDDIHIKISKFAGKISISVYGQNFDLPQKVIDHINASNNAKNSTEYGDEHDAFISHMIAQNLVDLHQGNLQILSTKGEGTRVTIKLPLGLSLETQKPFNPVHDLINLNDNRKDDVANSMSLEGNILTRRTG